MKKALSILAVGILAAVVGAGAVPAGTQIAPASGGVPAGYFVPLDVPLSHYRIDAKLDPAAGLIEGRETIELKNNSARPIDTIALAWTIGANQTIDVSIGGAKLAPHRTGTSPNVEGPLFYSLPAPLPAGGTLAIDAAFRWKYRTDSSSQGFGGANWYPRLWWDGLPGADSYSVRLDVPAGFALAASGRKDGVSGRFEGRGIRSFGVYLAQGETAETREVEGVLITAIATEKGKKAARICLETAVEAIQFYKKWLGFYPFPFLSIVPGGPGRWGGYPMAPGIVCIHGLETYKDGEPPRHWQFIASHEIGHEYWSEWVLEGDDAPWLWICLGIHCDTTYMMATGHDPDRRVQWMGNYVQAVGMYYDLPLDITPAQEDRILYDRNNLVIHSKGPAFINALTVVLGPGEFDRIFRKALQVYGGKRLGWKEFQRFCEAETGESLEWFFQPWVRGNAYLCYAIESRESRPENGGFRTEIGVRRLGTMAMPVPVKAVFEDGTEQTALTDRTRPLDILVFRSRARLKDAVLDPERRLAMIPKPLPEIPAETAAALAWGFDPARSLEIYEGLRGLSVDTANLWSRLAFNLFESDRLTEAADCFRKWAGADPESRFVATSWLGAVEDLRGNRTEALKRYREALALDRGESYDYRNFGAKIDRAWLEARLKKPYSRESEFSLPETITNDALIEAVNRLNWTHEGRNPLMIYERAAGRDIRASDFWFKLGMLLFDSGFQEESLASFVKAASDPAASKLDRFAVWTWQGHLNDLLGRREAALAAYRKALEFDEGETMTHSQYRMKVNRAWIEARIRSPFAWKKAARS